VRLNRIHLILVSIFIIAALGFVFWLKAPFIPEQLIGGQAQALDEDIVGTPPGAARRVAEHCC
jgi:hypothetical protein